MVDMQRAISVIEALRGRLDAWVEIADPEDEREEDLEALREAKAFLRDAGVEGPSK